MATASVPLTAERIVTIGKRTAPAPADIAHLVALLDAADKTAG